MELDISKYPLIWDKVYYKNIELDRLVVTLRNMKEIQWHNQLDQISEHVLESLFKLGDEINLEFETKLLSL